MNAILALILLITGGLFWMMFEGARQEVRMKETHDCVREETTQIISYIYMNGTMIPYFIPHTQCVQYKKKEPVVAPPRSQ